MVTTTGSPRWTLAEDPGLGMLGWPSASAVQVT
jgi:hypothetical protein